MTKKKWQLAIDGFRKVLSLVPRHHQSLGNLGICYAMLGQKKRAIEALDKALELNPSYEFALRNRSLIERLDEGEPLS
jgi:lipoprotein NlpI